MLVASLLFDTIWWLPACSLVPNEGCSPLAVPVLKAAHVACCAGPQNQVTVQANPDYYSFALDNNGNLPQTKLDVLANDKGSGITIVGVTPLWDKPGTLSASADFIYYHVDQYR
jgi:hypothetical protein